MVPTVVFPVPPQSAITKLDRARVLKRRVAIVNTIGGYQLHGYHYQQICGNERGELCQDGYFHIRSIRAFLSMISGVHGGHIHVFSEDSTADFREGDLDLARAEARRVGCKPPCPTKWCVLILPDVRDDSGDCWAVALMDIVTRHLSYVTLDSADPD